MLLIKPAWGPNYCEGDYSNHAQGVSFTAETSTAERVVPSSLCASNMSPALRCEVARRKKIPLLPSSPINVGNPLCNSFFLFRVYRRYEIS
jgi:hypothetical protein